MFEEKTHPAFRYFLHRYDCKSLISKKRPINKEENSKKKILRNA